MSDFIKAVCATEDDRPLLERVNAADFDEAAWLADMSAALAAEGFSDPDTMARDLLESRRHPEQVCSMEDIFAEFGL